VDDGVNVQKITRSTLNVHCGARSSATRAVLQGVENVTANAKRDFLGRVMRNAVSETRRALISLEKTASATCNTTCNVHRVAALRRSCNVQRNAQHSKECGAALHRIGVLLRCWLF
jgi:hypothetical protein